jgi:hypothetical protein
MTQRHCVPWFSYSSTINNITRIYDAPANYLAIAMDIISGLTALALAASNTNNSDHPPAFNEHMLSNSAPDTQPPPLPPGGAQETTTTESDLSLTTAEDDAMPKRQREDEQEVTMPHRSSHTVIDTLHAFIQQERISNFNFSGQYSHCYMDQKELLVVTQAEPKDVAFVSKIAGKDTITIWDDWYTFDEPLRSDGFTRTVSVAVDGNEPTIENMVITECHRAYRTKHDAATWIRKTYSPAADDMYEMRFTDMQYEEQRMWWDRTGKSFRLLDLPGEMRNAIYLQIIGRIVVPDIVPHPRRKMISGVGQSFGDPARLGRNRDPDIERPNMTIMRTSKKVKAEATAVAYSDTTKRFTTLRARSSDSVDPEAAALTIFNSAWVLAPNAAFLRHIQLELTAADYMGMVGIVPRRGQPLAAGIYSFNIDTLKRFSGLQTLDFRFISPKHKNAVCPWVLYTPGWNHSCQKQWIDWFFVFAWDSLAASQKVKFTLSGCVKNSSRVYWERVLNDRTDHAAEIKQREQQIRAEKIDDGPIECRCSNLCYTDPKAKRLFNCEEHEVRRIMGMQQELDKVYWDFND